MRLVVSDAARRDLRGIAQHGTQEWGQERSERYMAAVRERLAMLQRRPRIGAPRTDLRPGYRSMPVGVHTIFYRCEDDMIVIQRVLHQRMDIKKHL